MIVIYDTSEFFFFFFKGKAKKRKNSSESKEAVSKPEVACMYVPRVRAVPRTKQRDCTWNLLLAYVKAMISSRCKKKKIIIIKS